MTLLEEIHTKVAELLTMNGKYTVEQIKELLLKYSEDKKKHYAIFLNKLSSTPEEEAKALVEHLKSLDQDLITDIEAVRNSVTFNLKTEKWIESILKEVFLKKESFGSTETGNGKTCVLDYSSPNIAKIFHVGHFRTTILGNFIKNMLKFNGFNTVSINYLGDWGKQFGLVLLGYKLYGSEEKLKEDSLMHLFHVYVEVNKHPEFQQQARDIFKAMEDGSNQEYIDQWKMFREISIAKYKTLYKKLNVEFDVYSGESCYNQPAIQFAKQCEFAVEDEDGSRFIDTGKSGKALIMKSDGTTLYITRDIAAIQDRFTEYNPHKIIYVVSSEQDQHFQQLFEVAERIGLDKSKLLHVNFGLVKGMSTREGTVHFIDDVIEVATSVFAEMVKDKDTVKNKEQTALTLAISFLIVQDFLAKRIKGYTFDIKKQAYTTKGQSLGPTLQYTHCRLKGIEDMNSDLMTDDISGINMSHVKNESVAALMHKLLWFENVMQCTLKDYEPSRVVLYLQDLCNVINGAINDLRVKDAEPEVAGARLSVFRAARQVLKNGIEMLGLDVLNKM